MVSIGIDIANIYLKYLQAIFNNNTNHWTCYDYLKAKYVGEFGQNIFK